MCFFIKYYIFFLSKIIYECCTPLKYFYVLILLYIYLFSYSLSATFIVKSARKTALKHFILIMGDLCIRRECKILHYTLTSCDKVFGRRTLLSDVFSDVRIYLENDFFLSEYYLSPATALRPFWRKMKWLGQWQNTYRKLLNLVLQDVKSWDYCIKFSKPSIYIVQLSHYSNLL